MSTLLLKSYPYAPESETAQPTPYSKHRKSFWLVKPVGTLSVLRRCPRCGQPRRFISSGRFRVNTQQRNLDVWLVYRCEACESSWNLEVVSRVLPESLATELYQRYQNNDPAAARACAFDRVLLQKNSARADYSSLELSVSGAAGRLVPPVEIIIEPEFPLEIRLEKLLCAKLGLSRSQLRAMAARGEIACPQSDILKVKLVRPLTVLVGFNKTGGA